MDGLWNLTAVIFTSYKTSSFLLKNILIYLRSSEEERQMRVLTHSPPKMPAVVGTYGPGLKLGAGKSIQASHGCGRYPTT